MRREISDEEIVRLFFARDEKALRLTEEKHGKAILLICKRILPCEEDALECENSVLFTAWKRIPPEKPLSLSAFLSKIARDTAIDLLRKKTGQMRKGQTYAVRYDELSDLLCDDDDTVEDALENKELSEILNRFLLRLSTDARRLFILRYYHEMSVIEISRLTGLTRQGVYFKLNETKEKLKIELEKEGYLP